MKRTLITLRRLPVILLIAATVSCGSSESFFDQFSLQGTNESMNEIAGSWTATYANFGYAGTGPVVNVEIIGMGGSASIVIQTDGRFTYTSQLPGEAATVVTGQLGFDEDLLVVYDDATADWEYFSIQYAGSMMTLSGPAEYDFDGDGTDDPANLTLMLQR